jgi:hypothetical protein
MIYISLKQYVTRTIKGIVFTLICLLAVFCFENEVVASTPEELVEYCQNLVDFENSEFELLIKYIEDEKSKPCDVIYHSINEDRKKAFKKNKNIIDRFLTKATDYRDGKISKNELVMYF